MISLSEAEKQKLITELEQFHVGLVKYKQLVLAQKRVLVKIDYPILSGQVEEEFNHLSLELPRKYGSLKKVIEEYGGPAIILLQGGTTQWEAFSSTFNYTMFDPDTFISVIDTAITTVNIAIGNLEKLPLPETVQVQAPQETIFPSGKTYDAYKTIMDIITSATNKLLIVDPYVDSSLFTMLENVQSEVQIQILTEKMKGDFQLAGKKFKEQREESHEGTIEIRKSGKFHDRFIVSDENIFHIGASIKDAGTKMCLLKELEGSDIKTTLRKIISGYWDEAEIVL